MINVNQITSQLAKMPDQALQKYAAMHKSDPYIVALAVAESNRRKEIRSGAQMQAQPQPKVVDAELQGMAAPMPESVGIGALPAGDMQFADGGIVAFADGGDVERYNGEKSSYIPAENENPLSIGAFMRRWQHSGKPLLPYLGLETTRTPEYYPESTISGKGPSNKELEELYGLNSEAPKAEDKTANTRGAVNQNANSLLSATALPTATAGTAGLAALDPNKLFATALAKAGEDKRPEEDMLKAITRERTAAAEEEKKGLERLNEKFADAYKGRRERLDKQEAELGGRKDQYMGLALLQAGAAMMSTPGAIGTAIGKGVQAGSQQYVTGMDKLNAAKEKLADARDRLDDLQLNRDEMSAREILKAENKIRDTAISGKENMVKFVMERDKINRETALKIVDNQIKLGITQIEQSGQNARTNAQIAATLNTPERQMWNAALAKHDGDTAAAFKELQTLKAEKFNPYQSYADYLKAFAGKENVLTPPMDFASYASQFSVPTTKAPPANATVRTLPGAQ
jgi:hypothetical protein